MGVYNEFYVFNEFDIIPVAYYNIHNRAIGLFFQQNISDFKKEEWFTLTKSHFHNLILRYENKTLTRSLLTHIEEPILYLDQIEQLRELKKYIDDGLKVVYMQG